MNGLYIIGGIVAITFGIYQTVTEVKIFKAGKQSKFGWDIKGLAGGVGFIIIGVYLFLKGF